MKIPITPTGYKKFKLELRDLKKVQRPKVIKEIATARAHGDLSENAEYSAAREKQSFIEGKIKNIETTLTLSEVIDPSTISNEVIQFGATVSVRNLDTDKLLKYRLVGDIEADISSGSISITSPLAKGLIGKKSKDIIELNTPSGSRVYEIITIEYI